LEERSPTFSYLSSPEVEAEEAVVVVVLEGAVEVHQVAVVQVEAGDTLARKNEKLLGGLSPNSFLYSINFY
jgi:hypothetical protein